MEAKHQRGTTVHVDPMASATCWLPILGHFVLWFDSCMFFSALTDLTVLRLDDLMFSNAFCVHVQSWDNNRTSTPTQSMERMSMDCSTEKPVESKPYGIDVSWYPDDCGHKKLDKLRE